MAALQPAVDRIRYLAGISEVARATPATLHSRPYPSAPNETPAKIIRSYGKTIAYKDGDVWVITTDASTPTTNRHIQAAREALT